MKLVGIEDHFVIPASFLDPLDISVQSLEAVSLDSLEEVIQESSKIYGIIFFRSVPQHSIIFHELQDRFDDRLRLIRSHLWASDIEVVDIDTSRVLPPTLASNAGGVFWGVSSSSRGYAPITSVVGSS